MSDLQNNIAAKLHTYLSAGYSGWGAWLKAFMENREAGARGKPVHDLLEQLNALTGDDDAIKAQFGPLLKTFQSGIRSTDEVSKDAGVAQSTIETSNALQCMLTEIYALVPEWEPKADSVEEEGKVRAVSPAPAAAPVPAAPRRPAPPVPAAAPLVAAAVAPVPQRMDPPPHSPVVAAEPKPVPRRRSRRSDTSGGVVTRAMVKQRERDILAQQARRDAARMMTVDQFCAGGKAADKPAASAVEKAGMFARNAAAQRAEARVAQLRHEARRDATSPTESGDYPGLRFDV
ncbi:MAG: hypothetical protein P1U40_01710 [Coxiellaceae bacterium]|nr:hypothetical protein [Coxiellaceae bacterium]